MRTVALLLDPPAGRRVEALQLGALLADRIAASGDRLVLFSDPLGALLIGCAAIGASAEREAEPSEPERSQVILVPVIENEDPFARTAREGAPYNGDSAEEDAEGTFGGLDELRSTAAIDILADEGPVRETMHRVLRNTRPALGIIVAARPGTAQFEAMVDYEWAKSTRGLVSGVEFVASRPGGSRLVEDSVSPDPNLLRIVLGEQEGEEENPFRMEIIGAVQEAMRAEAWLAYLDE